MEQAGPDLGAHCQIPHTTRNWRSQGAPLGLLRWAPVNPKKHFFVNKTSVFL